MANKSGYFTDSEGNHLLGATLGENVFLSDGTDLETKLNNLSLIPKIQSKTVSGTTSASGAISLSLPTGAKVLNVVVMSATNQFAFFRHDGYAHIYQMSEASSTLGYLVRIANISVTVEVYYFV